jgi:predicted enzyme related to lactoylglutathione lyase
MTQRPNPVIHLELHTGDLAAASAFFAELCGWQLEHIRIRSDSYLALQLARGLSGGMVECPTERPIWLPYVEVADIGRSTEKARVCGASVLLGPREGSAGWRSVVSTPTGGEIAFWQSKSPTRPR